MAIFSKIVKGIFGDKPAKDKKLIWPIVNSINEFQETLLDKSILLFRYNSFGFPNNSLYINNSQKLNISTVIWLF